MTGMPSLFVYDFHIEEAAQRKGLGRHLVNLLQLIARKHGMSAMQMAVPEGCDGMEALLENKCGFAIDEMEYATQTEEELEEDLANLTIWSKSFSSRPAPLQTRNT